MLDKNNIRAKYLFWLTVGAYHGREGVVPVSSKALAGMRLFAYISVGQETEKGEMPVFSWLSSLVFLFSLHAQPGGWCHPYLVRSSSLR